MSANPPRVSVVTTVYNGERFLAEAIESILGQTFGDFEYILVDDASSDSSPRILQHYAHQDRRILVLRNSSNCNVSYALNRALETASGEYFANLDQDDIAYPRRLELQVAFLDSHPEVVAVGAQAVSMDATGALNHPLTYAQSPEMARWSILFGAPILHSTAMMRRSQVLAVGGYPVRQWFVNDFILYAELMRLHQLANLPDTLVGYRRHGQQTASVFSKPQRGQAWLLIHSLLAERLGLRVSLSDIGLIFDGVRGVELQDDVALLRAADLLTMIWERYLAVEQPDPATTDEIDADCARRLLAMAWTHRRSQRPASRVLLARALAIDPRLWQRPQTCALLRRLRHK